jgi:hypothetical protein
MKKTQEVFEYSKELFSNWFSDGRGLRNYDLKNYTSGDHEEEGFESITNKVMHKALTIYGLTDRCTINSDYFKDSFGIDDDQRLDHHVWIDDKVVIVEENRAWIDKPFYILKRAVVFTFMKLGHVRNNLSDDVVFIFSSLARDVTKKTKSTSDKVFGYGDYITEVNFSGHPRRPYKYNYFDNGYSETELLKYVETLCEVFSKYEK